MNSSSQIIKTDGTVINSDDILEEIDYPSGSYHTFTLDMSPNASQNVVTSRNFYPVSIKKQITLDLSMIKVNSGGSVGSLISIVICTFVNNTTLKVEANAGEFPCDIYTVQSQSINLTLSAGNYWIGIANNSTNTVNAFAQSVSCLENVSVLPSLTSMNNYSLKVLSASYSYPFTVGSNVTVADNSPGTPNFVTAKFRIA